MGLSNALVLPVMSVPHQLAPSPALSAAWRMDAAWGKASLVGPSVMAHRSRMLDVTGTRMWVLRAARPASSRVEPQLLGAGRCLGL